MVEVGRELRSQKVRPHPGGHRADAFPHAGQNSVKNWEISAT